MGPTAGLDGCGKSHLHRDFVCIVLYLYFIRPCFFVLHFAFLSLVITHNTKIHAPVCLRIPNPASDRSQVLVLDRSATGIGRTRSPGRAAHSESLSRPAIANN